MAARASLIVLDRDGVLNRLIDNPAEPRPDSPMRVAEVQVFPWVPAALRDLTEAGFGLTIASNQPSWAKGKTTRADLDEVHAAPGWSATARRTCSRAPRTACARRCSPPPIRPS